jgi:hypothetical protein
MPKIIDYGTTTEGMTLKQALSLHAGEMMFLPAGTRPEASKLCKDHVHVAGRLGINSLLIFPDYKDSRWWLCIKPRVGAIAYKKDKEGTVSVMPITKDDLRQAELMIQDTYSFEQIQEYIPSFTETQFIHLKGTLSRRVKI